MATIQDVAREAGVSLTTVSHVFSGKRKVAPETIERVRAVARRLRYQPHRVARGLATGRTLTIALHFPFEADSFVLDPYFPKLFEGMSAAAAEAGYGFILLPSADERAFPLPRFLRERRFDGAIVVDPLRTNTLIPLLRRHTVPLVTTGRYQGKDGSALPWVDNDNRGGLTQLLDHLRDQGYERPAMISMKGGSYATDIEEVFASAVAGTIVRAAAISDNEGYRLGRRLLQGRDPPDAILTAGDRQAVGVLRAARELGVAVPSSLGVAGAGDTVLAAHSNPQLTSIRVSVRQLGELSVRCLLSLLDGGDAEIEGTILPTKLVVRASTRRERTRRQRTR